MPQSAALLAALCPTPAFLPPCCPLLPCRVLVEDGAARGIVTADGRERRAQAVVVNADPFCLRQLAGGAAAFPADFNARLDGMRRDGTTMKMSRSAGSRGAASPNRADAAERWLARGAVQVGRVWCMLLVDRWQACSCSQQQCHAPALPLHPPGR